MCSAVNVVLGGGSDAEEDDADGGVSGVPVLDDFGAAGCSNAAKMSSVVATEGAGAEGAGAEGAGEVNAAKSPKSSWPLPAWEVAEPNAAKSSEAGAGDFEGATGYGSDNHLRKGTCSCFSTLLLKMANGSSSAEVGAVGGGDTTVLDELASNTSKFQLPAALFWAVFIG